MKTYLAFFVVSLITSLAVTPVVRTLATRLRVIDRAGGRRVHEGEIPRLGGVAVVLSLAAPFLGFVFHSNLLLESIIESWQPLMGLILGAGLVFLLGVWDDVKGLPPWPKLFVETVAATLAFLLGLRIEVIGTLIGIPMDLSWLSAPVTILWLVGMTNAINLADGVDGLAAGITAFAAATLFLMTFETSYSVVALVAASLAGACIGFLRYNFHPATIFLGDSGALFLGFLLGGLSIWASEKSAITFALLIPLVALGLPLADAFYAILRRWYRGIPISQADREHIHHKLLEMGFSHRRAVLALYGVNVVLMVLAGMLLLTRNSVAAFVLVFVGLALIGGFRILGYMRFSRLFREAMRAWRASRQIRYVAFRARVLTQAFERESTLTHRWNLLVELLQDLGFSRATFVPSGPFPPLTWENGNNAEKDRFEEVLVSIPVMGEKGLAGRLSLYRHSANGALPPGISAVLDTLTSRFAQHLQREEGCTTPQEPKP